MQNRSEGFLSEHYDPDTEIGSYIRELHEYLWRFVRVTLPHASGNLNEYVDIAVREAEADAQEKRA